MICEAFNPGYSKEEVATIVDDVVPLDDLARQGLHPEDKVELVLRLFTGGRRPPRSGHGKPLYPRYVSANQVPI